MNTGQRGLGKVKGFLEKKEELMGAVESRLDARAAQDFTAAFTLSLEILNRKGSKRLMAAEIEECLDDLETLGKLALLPANFQEFSVYGQRELLNKVSLTRED